MSVRRANPSEVVLVQKHSKDRGKGESRVGFEKKKRRKAKGWVGLNGRVKNDGN